MPTYSSKSKWYELFEHLDESNYTKTKYPAFLISFCEEPLPVSTFGNIKLREASFGA